MFKFSWRLTSFSAAKPSHHLPVSSRECVFVVCANTNCKIYSTPKELFPCFSNYSRRFAVGGAATMRRNFSETNEWNFQIIHRFHPSSNAVNTKMFEFQLQFSMIYFLFFHPLDDLQWCDVFCTNSLCVRWMHVKVPRSRLLLKTLVNFNFSSSCRSRLPNISSNKK